MFSKIFLTILMLPAMAWAWHPTKPVNVVVGFAPGSLNETTFRVVAQQVQRMHPNFTYRIELKPGADSVIAHNALAAAVPDGHTVGVTSILSLYITNGIWQRESMKFQTDSLVPVTTLGAVPMAIVANVNSKINTPAELNRVLKETTTPVNFAVGAGAHRLTWELIMDRARGNRDLVKFTQYNGPVQATTAIASDAGIEFGVVPVNFAMPLIQAGKLKLIGVSGNKKTAGVDPYRVENQVLEGTQGEFTLTLPPNTASDITKWYHNAFTAALQTAEVQKFLADNYLVIEATHTSTAGLVKRTQELQALWLPLAPRLIANK
jgi:tripartite-type tricarboxylate transporter receptor subunit TctC